MLRSISTAIIKSFPVSSSMGKKKIFGKRYGVTDLLFKIEASDGKKCVKFVAVQQKSATLIYDLNIMKGTVESYHKRIVQPFRTVQFHA